MLVVKACLSTGQYIIVLDWYHANSKNQSCTASHFKSIFPKQKMEQLLVSSWVKDEAKISDQHRDGDFGKVKSETKPLQVTNALQTWVQQAALTIFPLNGASLPHSSRFLKKNDLPPAMDGWIASRNKLD